MPDVPIDIGLPPATLADTSAEGILQGARADIHELQTDVQEGRNRVERIHDIVMVCPLLPHASVSSF